MRTPKMLGLSSLMLSLFSNAARIGTFEVNAGSKARPFRYPKTYSPNGKRERERRMRQIANGQLKVSA